MRDAAPAEIARAALSRRPQAVLQREGRRIPYTGAYRMAGRWLTEEYTPLRNAAWAVRNSRVGTIFNPLALRLVLAEATALLERGEQLHDILEAFAELLTRP